MINQDQSSHLHDDTFDNSLANKLQQSHKYLPDDGFAAQVMGQLPAPKKLLLWQERLIIFIPFLIISLLVLSQFPILAVAIKLWVLMLMINFTEILQIGFLTTAVVVLGATFWFLKQLRII